MLHTTEDFIKNQKDWPINVTKRQKAEEERREKEKQQKGEQEPPKEHEWRRSRGENETHNKAHATDQQDTEDGNQEEGQKNEGQQPSLQDKYSPQELSLLRLLQHESGYMKTLQENDGNIDSPIIGGEPIDVSIDEADQFTPDNWIPRSPHLIRLTGKHPLNGEPDLQALYEAGLITPNQLHYVRNHGPVPHLLWETHTVDVDNRTLVLSMDNLQNDFDSINIAVALACNRNCRKELNMFRRSKWFNWGASAISCVFWKGPLLQDVLLAAGFKDPNPQNERCQHWVHFKGADELSKGKYATSIPFTYVMNPENNIILAYEMNNMRLPPDHSYPVRLMVPGYIRGCCIKWLKRIWESTKENNSHYHIWDNRVFPSFILDMDSEFSHTMFHHLSTACNKQNLNLIIMRPAHSEKIHLSDVKKSQSYHIAGLAYDGGGHEVQRVEVSLDDGKTWLYCVRKVSRSQINCFINQREC